MSQTNNRIFWMTHTHKLIHYYCYTGQKKFHEIGPWHKIPCNSGCWTFPWCLHSFYGSFLLTNERRKKTFLFLNGKPFEFCGGIFSFLSSSFPHSFVFFFFAQKFKYNYEFKGCTKKVWDYDHWANLCGVALIWFNETWWCCNLLFSFFFCSFRFRSCILLTLFFL